MRPLLPLLILLFITITTTIHAQNALDFDGTNDYISVTGYKGITGTSARTIEAWIKVPTGATNHGIVCWGTNSSTQKWTFRIQNTNGSVDGNLRIECNGGYKTGSTDLRDDQWHHVAVVWQNDGTPNITDALLYVDGILETTDVQQNWSVNTASVQDVRIGRRHVSGGFFDGGIEEMRIWSEARTQSEIVANMNKELCSDPNLELYMRFNQGTANGNNSQVDTAYDETPNQRDGVLHDFALSGSGSNWIGGVNLTQADPPSIQLSSIADVDCYGDSAGSISIQVSGGATPYVYAWSNGDSATSLSGLPAGNYTVIVIDDSLCAAQAIFEIDQGDPIIISGNSSGVICADDADGEVQTTAWGGTGPLTYSWSNGSTGDTVTSLTAGLYTITVTDSLGCTTASEYEVPLLFDSLVVSSLNIIDVTCIGDSTGFVTVDVSGGLAPYTYQWDDPAAQTTNPAILLPEGSYVVTVTDANDCQTEATVVVGYTNELPIVDLGPNINEVANQVQLNGPAGFAVYQWSTGASSSSITVTQSGTYALTVTDDDGCSGADTIKVKLTPVGIRDILVEDSWLSVFPNPTKGHVTLRWVDRNEIVYVQLMDATGRSVSKHFIQGYPSNEIQMEFKAEPGLYLLKAASSKGETRSIPLVIE